MFLWYSRLYVRVYVISLFIKTLIKSSSVRSSWVCECFQNKSNKKIRCAALNDFVLILWMLSNKQKNPLRGTGCFRNYFVNAFKHVFVIYFVNAFVNVFVHAFVNAFVNAFEMLPLPPPSPPTSYPSLRGFMDIYIYVYVYIHTP